ncbi:MAG TPA: hypothetical protein VGC69_10120, partial [Bordetella sp.]
VRAVLRAGILPQRFFDLLGCHDDASRQQHAALRRVLAGQALDQAPEALFDFTLLQDDGGRPG